MSTSIGITSPSHAPKIPDYSAAIHNIWPNSFGEPEVTLTLENYLATKKAILKSDLWNTILLKVVQRTANPILTKVEGAAASAKIFRRGIIAGAAIADEMSHSTSYSPSNDPLVQTLLFTEQHPEELCKLGLVHPLEQDDPTEIRQLSEAIGGEQASVAHAGIMLVFHGIAAYVGDCQPTSGRAH